MIHHHQKQNLYFWTTDCLPSSRGKMLNMWSLKAQRLWWLTSQESQLQLLLALIMTSTNNSHSQQAPAAIWLYSDTDICHSFYYSNLYFCCSQHFAIITTHYSRLLTIINNNDRKVITTLAFCCSKGLTKTKHLLQSALCTNQRLIQLL